MTRCGTSARIFASLNVPGSLSSALQMTYFGRRVSFRDQLPLGAGGEPGPAHAAQAGCLESGDSPLEEVAGSALAGHGRVAIFGRGVRVAGPASRRVWPRVRDTGRVGKPGRHLVDVGHGYWNVIDGARRRHIAATDTRHFAYLHAVGLQLVEPARTLFASGQPARHVAADDKFHSRRRRSSKVRIEADEFLKPIERDRVFFGQVAKGRLREVAVLVLGLGQERDQAHERTVSRRGRPIVPQLILQGRTSKPRPGPGRTSAAPASSWPGPGSGSAARRRSRTC